MKTQMAKLLLKRTKGVHIFYFFIRLLGLHSYAESWSHPILSALFFVLVDGSATIASFPFVLASSF